MSQVDTELEKGLLAILCTFHKYTQGKMGDLHQAAFHSLLRSELCHLLTDTEQQEVVRMVFTSYDADGNQKLSFDEYVNLIACILRKLCQPWKLRHAPSWELLPSPSKAKGNLSAFHSFPNSL